jgi:hypothetical protein
MVGVIFIWYIIALIKDNSFQNGYWKGRAAGWDSHRRITNIAKSSDEVFDYEKH